jgi:hypothetical protein
LAGNDINKALRTASRILSCEIEELRNITPSRVLFVYRPDLKSVRARILPLFFDSTALPISRDGKRHRPAVVYDGRRIFYVIEYGRGFLRASPASRLRTLVHELLHSSPFFNGTLSRRFRHSNMDDGDFGNRISGILSRLDARAINLLEASLDFGRECQVLKWREPFSLMSRGAFGEKDLARVMIRRGPRDAIDLG